MKRLVTAVILLISLTGCLVFPGCGGPNPFDAINNAADQYGVPTRISDELKEENDTNFEKGDWPSYYPSWRWDVFKGDLFPDQNVVMLPEDTIARINNNKVRGTDLNDIYNELFSAYYDQILEECEKCRWLMELIEREASTNYNGNLEMVEEAMSETVDQVVDELVRASDRNEPPDLSYDQRAQPPGHNEEGEDWQGLPEAGRIISEDIYLAALWILFHDCDAPAGYQPDEEELTDHHIAHYVSLLGTLLGNKIRAPIEVIGHVEAVDREEGEITITVQEPASERGEEKVIKIDPKGIPSDLQYCMWIRLKVTDVTHAEVVAQKVIPITVWVEYTNPYNKQDQVPVHIPWIEVNFTETMDTTRTTEACFAFAPAIDFTLRWSPDEKTAYLDLNTLLMPAMTYTCLVTEEATSIAGVFPGAYIWEFTTEALTEEHFNILRSSPSPGTDNATLETPIKFFFPAPVDEDSIMRALTIFAEGQNLTEKDFIVSFQDNSQTVIIRPVAAWQPATLHSVTMSTEARSKEGLHLEKDYTFSFKTEEGAAEPVSVIATYPAQDGIVGQEDQVKIVFSVPMDKDATEQALIVFPPIKYAVSWDNDSREMTIHPFETWQPATVYNVIVSSEAKSLEGLTLEKSYDFSFTTEEMAIGPVSVIGTYPAQGGILADSKTMVKVLFSGPVKILPDIKINTETKYEAFLEDNDEVLAIYPEGEWPADIPVEITIDLEGEVLSEPFTLTFSVE